MTIQPKTKNTVSARSGLPFWQFGLLVGGIIALVITIIITTWELIENPGGIYRRPDGIYWQFVFDTAVSWFIPVFIGFTVVAALGRLLVTWVRRRFYS